MPYLHATTGTMPAFVNVSQTVGADAPNLPEDVKFVQRALTTIYSNRHVKVNRNMGGLWSSPATKLDITGKCDRTTCHWIFKFQIDVSNQVGYDILIDGRVDSATKSSSTIVYLNRILQLNNPEEHAALLREMKPSSGRGLKQFVTETLRIPGFA